MKEWLIGALILLVIASCASPAISQEGPVQSPVDRGIEVATQRTPITRATPLRNALAFVTLLINPKDDYKPVPLYGYRISGLDNQTLQNALAAAAAGNAHVAIVDQRSDDDSNYTGRAVRISPEPGSTSNERPRTTLPASQTNYCTVLDIDNCMIAFTRPLRNQEIQQKFITKADLWAPFRGPNPGSGQARPNATP